MALAPVSSITRFFSAHGQSCVEHSARVHSATLLECAMCLTNGQLTPPFIWGHAKVVPSTMGRRLLPSASSHKNRVIVLSNRHSAHVGAAAEHT